MQSLMTGFMAELTRKAQAEAPAAEKKFAQDPGAFRRWCAELLQNFRGQLTTDNFLQWAGEGENQDELQRAIDSEAPAALRELDRILLEVGAEIDRAHQAAEAAKRPPEPDTQRKPPTREELLSPSFMSRDYNYNSTHGAISGRTRRNLRRKI